MSVKPGTYSIRVEKDPSPLVGVDGGPPGAPPVITNADNRIWQVTQNSDGTYSLAVQVAGSSLFAEGDGDTVIASIGGASSRWTITGPEGGPNIIQIPRDIFPSIVWTVQDPSPNKRPVTLQALEFPENAPGNQKWYFVRPQPK